ncbi:hypothetical protein QBC36DRAFT_102557 [Triangularia setosa]|uniref:Uncharacterized protein n=1 Tax=Triangularia setosa TaxID=2587417 RepID=A0AAN6WBH1_9PEZI|nr:hypothetical protein QBC36DRAFT_102557 [Podospora setosa]
MQFIHFLPGPQPREEKRKNEAVRFSLRNEELKGTGWGQDSNTKADDCLGNPKSDVCSWPGHRRCCRLLHLASRLHRRSSPPWYSLPSKCEVGETLALSPFCLSDPAVTSLVACDRRNVSGVAGVSERISFPVLICRSKKQPAARQVVLSRWLTLAIPRASGQAEKICGDPALVLPLLMVTFSISVSVLDLFLLPGWNSSLFFFF